MNNPAAGMPCPVCKVPLAMSDRQGIEIDYCPQCRGVWLDRGELDKLIERSLRDTAQPAAAPPPAQPQPRPQPGYAEPRYERGYSQPHHHHGYGHRKRKKSFLEELFD